MVLGHQPHPQGALHMVEIISLGTTTIHTIEVDTEDGLGSTKEGLDTTREGLGNTKGGLDNTKEGLVDTSE